MADPLAHALECPCRKHVALSWGTAPEGIPLYKVRCSMKLNGIPWNLNLTMRCVCIMSHHNVLRTLYADPADSYATSRHRREPVTAFIIPRCNGGSHLCIRVGDKVDTNLLLGEPPQAFLNRKKTMTFQYAMHIRQTQPIKRGARLLMTQHDRAVLCLLMACMGYNKRLPSLPSEIREIVIAFLNMSHLQLTHAIEE